MLDWLKEILGDNYSNEVNKGVAKKIGEYFGLDKTKDFEDFSQKYLKTTKNGNKIKGKVNVEYSKEHDELKSELDKLNVEYNTVNMHNKPPGEEEIIKLLGRERILFVSWASRRSSKKNR